MRKVDSKNPLLIKVTSDGETLGHLTPEQFREHSGRLGGFLEELINQFNTEKRRLQEPERAEIVFNYR